MKVLKYGEESVSVAFEEVDANLSARTIELEVIPALRDYGIALIPWSPIGMGLLGGALRKASEGRRASPVLQMRSAAAAWYQHDCCPL